MTPVSSLSSQLAAAAAPPGASQANDVASADRFLRLLVAQMQNQDPLNPLDNAQVTSQMAQINTVTGIEKLNGTVAGLNRSMVQMQALQGASLVGRDVTLEGNRLALSGGLALGGFELNSTADRVRVEVLDAVGRVVDTLDLGTQPAGRHGFQWEPPQGLDLTGYRFRVEASAGTLAIGARPLMMDRVFAVRTVGDQLTLDTLASGPVPYTAVLAVN
jgi:flagellar basal-body rod modification protein FlgD